MHNRTTGMLWVPHSARAPPVATRMMRLPHTRAESAVVPFCLSLDALLCGLGGQRYFADESPSLPPPQAQTGRDEVQSRAESKLAKSRSKRSCAGDAAEPPAASRASAAQRSRPARSARSRGAQLDSSHPQTHSQPFEDRSDVLWLLRHTSPSRDQSPTPAPAPRPRHPRSRAQGTLESTRVSPKPYPVPADRKSVV